MSSQICVYSLICNLSLTGLPQSSELHEAQLATCRLCMYDSFTCLELNSRFNFSGTARSAGAFGASGNSQQAVLGFVDHGDGRVAVYGDSNCLDSSHQRSSCHNLLLNAISYVAEVRPNLSVAIKIFFYIAHWHSSAECFEQRLEQAGRKQHD